MKVIKLDRRYAGYPEWRYACQFPLKNHNFRKEYFDYRAVFQSIYGPDAVLNEKYNPAEWGDHPKWEFNKHWRADFPRQRILVKDQALITMIRLKIAD